ncbi:MAG: hypothetical protein ACLUCR_07945, partial [Limosilactobacillus fermentum]
ADPDNLNVHFFSSPDFSPPAQISGGKAALSCSATISTVKIQFSPAFQQVIPNLSTVSWG